MCVFRYIQSTCHLSHVLNEGEGSDDEMAVNEYDINKVAIGTAH